MQQLPEPVSDGRELQIGGLSLITVHNRLEADPPEPRPKPPDRVDTVARGKDVNFLAVALHLSEHAVR